MATGGTTIARGGMAMATAMATAVAKATAATMVEAVKATVAFCRGDDSDER